MHIYKQYYKELQVLITKLYLCQDTEQAKDRKLQEFSSTEFNTTDLDTSRKLTDTASRNLYILDKSGNVNFFYNNSIIKVLGTQTMCNK